MPLAFESLSHGTVAFGFFNIESDMLLLDRYFLFAEDFCGYLNNIAKNVGDQPYHCHWDVKFIEMHEAIGDLMGAIHGIHFTGFIGEMYRCFPFPRQDEDFKQKAEGFQTQPLVSEIITSYAQPEDILVSISPGGDEIEIGAYRFNRVQFLKLIQYVWRGGYPRWKDNIRPGYVIMMKNTILQNRSGLFRGINFEDSW